MVEDIIKFNLIGPSPNTGLRGKLSLELGS